MSRRLHLELALLLCGCGGELPPLGQLRLHVTTDALLPRARRGSTPPDEPPPLFDRLRVDFLLPGEDAACSGCSNEFALDRQTVDAGRASVGFAPPAGEDGFRARVRIFPSAFVLAAEPPPGATLDVTVALPEVGAEGIADVTVALYTDDVGVRIGDPEPIEPLDGPPAPGFVGSWWGAKRVGCAGPAPPGRVCVPGGPFWMGSSRVGLYSYHPIVEGERMRLVVLAPFYLDAYETTVAAYREYALVYGTEVVVWTGNSSGAEVLDGCTFTTFPSDRDDLPLTCIGWFEADRYCTRRGGTLPTEAQLEYVHGGLASRPYPWGTEEPACGDAVFARDLALRFGADECRPPGAPGGPLAVHRVPRDDRDWVAQPDGSKIYDLAGSVNEWARDEWNGDDEPCWAAPGVYVDPVCRGVPSADGAANRAVGGYWGSVPAELQAAIRAYFPATAFSDATGVRCASPAESARL